MFTTKDIRGTLQDPIRVTDMSGEMLFNCIKDEMHKAIQAKGVPANMREDIMKSGGLWGTKAPMLMITHPSPPNSFFAVGIVVNEDIVSFVLLGSSAENFKKNEKMALEAEGKHIRAAFIHPDEMILQQEVAWQRRIMECFDTIFA